ncbi:LysE family transporter [Candidatus Thioglobus sp.]|nr:LysE family transporter [Candidatus Thioglobus sp.]MDB3892878.1 LysE family transporter [Candidatus Thioglobus sp.]MDC0919777.1 LysE family transporter [Candidatus Thioglobus sp.]MDC0964821.1 LysE family transporter [Candidatus Thioglobus sp.]
MSIETWVSLIVASFFISLSPGPGAITTINQSIRYGFKKSLYTIIGLQIGYGVQIVFVSIGIGLFITSNEFLFAAIKWVGVVYLVVLGLQQWLAKPEYVDLAYNQTGEKFTAYKHFLKASFINLLNLKATVFLIIFIPLFIQPELDQSSQISIIVVTLLVVDIFIMLGYATLSNYIRKWVDNDKVKYLNRFTGAVLILVGLSIGYQL